MSKMLDRPLIAPEVLDDVTPQPALPRWVRAGAVAGTVVMALARLGGVAFADDGHSGHGSDHSDHGGHDDKGDHKVAAPAVAAASADHSTVKTAATAATAQTAVTAATAATTPTAATVQTAKTTATGQCATTMADTSIPHTITNNILASRADLRHAFDAFKHEKLTATQINNLATLLNLTPEAVGKMSFGELLGTSRCAGVTTAQLLTALGVS